LLTTHCFKLFLYQALLQRILSWLAVVGAAQGCQVLLMAAAVVQEVY
jgi:hypothetical protein